MQDLLSVIISRLTCLPGVGKKTAQRYTYYLLERDRKNGTLLGEELIEAMQKIGNCKRCRTFTENEICHICENPKRDTSLLCIVESPADLLAIESSANYRGLYFVLHGKLSPLDDLGPEEIGLPELEKILNQNSITELILATSTTVEGDVTAHIISEMASKYNVKISQIAQGVPVGGEIEYIDSSTLAKAFDTRGSY